ncbi:MAG TPA: sigma-70 family RNA polymerase sigma factor [Capillimicrobium sp.]|nr:sigma-70 family RNA polymerase sigma factor [Capillimicrobium sp.]
MTTIEAIFHEQRRPLLRRLHRMVGDPETAADLCQETFVRAWRKAPREATADQHRRWLHRTASNLAIDELRRRRLRDHAPLDHERWGRDDASVADRLHAREALERLAPHERLVLLLRFEAGLSHRELGALLDISEEAARKRVERARAAFSAAMRDERGDGAPVVLFLRGEFAEAPFRAWIEAAGGHFEPVDHRQAELQLATADALVLGASYRDIDPSLYGEQPRFGLGPTDRDADLADLRVLKTALAQDVPIVGICRGHQLINIAYGGSLWQDLPADGAGSPDHTGGGHRIRTGEHSLSRRVMGREAEVASEHHQAVRRLGRGVRPSSISPDGVVEMVEVPSRRFVLGLQWHAEREDMAHAGAAVAEALVAAARAA